MLDVIMNSSVVWLILAICTVGSMGFAIYTWLVGKKTKEISIDYYTNEIVKAENTLIPKLYMTFDGKKIKELSSTIFYIWNSGSDVINDNDIVKMKYLEIISKKDEILDAQIIRKSEESNNFVIKQCTEKNVQFDFEYVDCNEGITVQVLHMGNSDDLIVECKIKAGKKIRNCVELRKRKGIRKVWREIENIIMPMIIMLIASLISGVSINAFNLSQEIKYLALLCSSLVIGIVIMIMYFIIEKVIKSKFSRVIPASLKCSSK